MADRNGEIKFVPGVGSRVNIAVQGSADSDTVSGLVVEDYADMVIDSVGRDWAPVHRWAVALDDGRLVFAHDDDLTPGV